MPYTNFIDFPLWKEGTALADSAFDFSRAIEDFPIRNRMTCAAVEIPFLLGEAAQSESDEKMRDLLWKVEDPVNELRSALTEAKEQGFAPEADFEAMQEKCRDLFHKVHLQASEASSNQTVSTNEPEKEDPDLAPETLIEKVTDDVVDQSEETVRKASSNLEKDISRAPNNED